MARSSGRRPCRDAHVGNVMRASEQEVNQSSGPLQSVQYFSAILHLSSCTRLTLSIEIDRVLLRSCVHACTRVDVKEHKPQIGRFAIHFHFLRERIVFASLLSI
jgi:hypothetical protein